MITTFMHLALLSMLMGILSLFGVRLWVWLPAVCSITVTVQLLAMNFYCRSIMEGFLHKHAEQFSDLDEIEMMKTSPGIFIPQFFFYTNFCATDMTASLGWVRILSFISIILGFVFKNYIVSIIGLVIFLAYLFSQIGGMFYNNDTNADMFMCVRRYLSKINKNVKSMTDFELQIYALKYQTIVEKFRTLKQ